MIRNVYSCSEISLEDCLADNKKDGRNYICSTKRGFGNHNRCSCSFMIQNRYKKQGYLYLIRSRSKKRYRNVHNLPENESGGGGEVNRYSYLIQKRM